MRFRLAIILLTANLGTGCLVVSSGTDRQSASTGSTGGGASSSGGGTSAGTGAGTTTGGLPRVDLTVSPNPIDFGFDEWGHTVVGCATVTNEAYTTVQILGVSDFRNEMGAFSLSQVDDATPPNPAPVPVTIASGASANVCFSFNPPITQQYTGQATLETSDGPGPVVQFTGWGGGPQVQCLPQRIDFGQILDHPASIAIVCTNVGSAGPGPWADLTLKIVPPVPGLSAWFEPPEPDGGFEIGMLIQIAVSYMPPVECSDFSTELVLELSSGKGIEFPITGQGLCEPCELALSPSKLDFGNLAVGDTAPILTTSIQNLGSYPCDINGIKIEGDSSNSFQIVSTSIPPDPQTGLIWLEAADAGAASSMLVETSFAPQETGAFGGQLSIQLPEQDSPDVPLTGTSESTSTCLAVTPTTLNFGDAGAGQQLQFSVSNQCPGPALLQSMTLQSGPGASVAQYGAPFGPTLPAIISPGSPLTYELSCAPTTPGDHPAQLILSDGYVDTLLWLTCPSP